MRIHPLMAGAAASVMLLSLVGVAAITGYLPGSAAKSADQAASAPAAKPAPCADCGVVVAVRQVEVKGKGTGLGAVAGGVAGAVVGHEISDGKDLGTLVGAAGGAFAGHQIERHARTTKRFHVDVRMTDGTVKTVAFNSQPSWKSGDRVRLQNGKLISQDQPARTAG
jgi:outer membrane lipoprotein SlyB